MIVLSQWSWVLPAYLSQKWNMNFKLIYLKVDSKDFYCVYVKTIGDKYEALGRYL